MLKNIQVCVFIILTFLQITDLEQAFSAARISGDGSVHSMGNGKMCIYERGTDIITAYLGSYSSPSFLSTEWIKNSGETSYSRRKQGTAFWEHPLLTGSIESGKMLDFVDSQIPCFVRHFQTKNRITLNVKLECYVHVIDNSKLLKTSESVNGRLLTVPSGTIFYQTYASQRIIYSQIITSGHVRIQAHPGSSSLEIICEPGEGFLSLLSGKNN